MDKWDQFVAFLPVAAHHAGYSGPAEHKHLTNLTYLTFPLFLKHLLKQPFKHIQQFNISPVLGIVYKKYLTFPQFRDPRVTKMGKC